MRRRASAVRLTVRGKILLAFLAMGAITGCLGGYAVSSVALSGNLVVETFDRALMSIGYARAASADFAAMEASLARYGSAIDPARKGELQRKLDDLAQSLQEDLAIAAERSLSQHAVQAAQDVEQAVKAWQLARTHLRGGLLDEGGWQELDRNAAAVNEQFELLINTTAGDAFKHRQRALATIGENARLSVAFTVAALLLGAPVALLLARRIMGPVAAASAAADRIAGGQLDTVIPAAGADELGALLAAMALMRDNIRAMMEGEVAQRRSAQMRLVDAIEGSREGVIVVDRSGRIAIANTQMSKFFPDLAGLTAPGSAFSAAAAVSVGPEGLRATGAVEEELHLPAGQWLRVSRSDTREGGFVLICSDITAVKEHQAKLEQTNLCFDADLNNMSQGLCLFDGSNRLRVANARFCQIYNLPPGQVRPGLPFRDLLQLSFAAGNHAGKSLDEFYAARLEFIARGEAATLFQELADGRVIAISHEPMDGGGWVVTYEDITQRRHAEAQINFMARHDALTRLPNRVVFRERLEQAVAQLGRGVNFAALCLDLDHFKTVNDTMGHPAGDALLRAVADRLSACVRETDTVARLGGGEFAILQVGLDRPEEAGELARRIVDVLAAPYGIDGQQVAIGASVGIAVAPGDATGCDALLRNADLALYRAKLEGRGTYCFFEPEMDRERQARQAVEFDLRNASFDGELVLFYQPLVNLADDSICGVEALLRWIHPTRGMISPAEFIPVAEETGLIVGIGEWVIQRACTEAVQWPDRIKVAVNVSPCQFKSPRLVQVVTDALARSGLPARRLELEITESVLMRDNDETLATLHRLRGLGVRISMDDFGTGFSSLSSLHSFPFDKIKIDQSFVRDLATKTDSGAIVRAIAGLGSSLGMRTTAEGVETKAQLARVRAEGCTEVQGYLFSRPVPARSIPGLIEQLTATPALQRPMSLPA